MLEIKLRRLDFQTRPGHHTAMFEVAADNGTGFTLPVLVIDTGEGAEALLDRAHDNLLEFFKAALAEAQKVQQAWAKRGRG